MFARFIIIFTGGGGLFISPPNQCNCNSRSLYLTRLKYHKPPLVSVSSPHMHTHVVLHGGVALKPQEQEQRQCSDGTSVCAYNK